MQGMAPMSLKAITGQFSWPPAGSFVAIFFMTSTTGGERRPWVYSLGYVRRSVEDLQPEDLMAQGIHYQCVLSFGT